MTKSYTPLLDEKNKRTLELTSPKTTDKILVIGTGVYPKIEFFLNKLYKCKNITSGDIEKPNIQNAKKQLPQLKFIYLDAQKKFPFKDKSFDKIIFTDVLEHLLNETIALSEIQRILKQQGTLILSVPKRRWFNIFSPITHIQHIREYNEKTIKQALNKNNLKIDKLITGGDIFDLLSLWLHLILKHIFHYLHPDIFFEKQVNNSFKTGFKGTGTNIMLKASRIN